MTIYAQTWCPGDPCDPCACFALPATNYETLHALLEIDVNMGSLALCSKPFIWPFVRRSAPDLQMGTMGYYPLGLRLRGAYSPSSGVFLDSSETATLSYLGTEIFRATVTHQFIGRNNGAWAYQNITSVPAPVQPFQIKYADAVGIANGLGLSIQRFFGEYTQDPNTPQGPIGLTGFVYTGTLDNRQDKVLKATWQNVFGPGGSGFWPEGVIYYSPAAVPLVRSQLGHQLPLVARFQGY